MTMATMSKVILSGSTDGRNIPVSSVSSGSPNTIHTAITGTGNLDEVWIWALNTDDTSDVGLVIQFGGTTDPDDLFKVEIPHGEGLCLVIPGLVLQNGLVVGAYATVASKIVISGFINRITA
jgi:hypothetical protein